MGRTTGFSRLINEKTMIREATPLDSALERLCPPLASAEEAAALEAAGPLVDKFVKDLVQRMRSNPFHMVFDEPVALTGQDDLVWCPEEQRNAGVPSGVDLEFLLPFRRMAGTKLDHRHGPGYASIAMPTAARFEDSQSDVFEPLRSANGRLLSPRAACRVQHRVLGTAVRVLEERHGALLRVEELSWPDRANGIRLRVGLSPLYVERPSPEADDGRRSRRRRKEAEEDEEEGEDEEEEEEEEEEAEENALTGHPDPEKDCAPEGEDEADARPPETVFLNFRFFPAMNCNSKERVFFIARPYSFDRFTYKSDVWRYFYRFREAAILAPVFRADHSSRLRAMAGLARVGAAEPDLGWVSAEVARQLLLGLVQMEVDEVAHWQRLSLTECLREMFGALRECCNARRLEHFFVDGLNLLQAVPPDRLARAAVRCAVLGRSDSALVRAAEKACEAPPPAVEAQASEVDAAGTGGGE